MAFKKKSNSMSVQEGDVHTGTEAWNIAQYFTGYSIALPLDELNKLEDTARFGTVKMDEDLLMPDDQLDKRRAEAVKRYWNKLKQVVSDTLFKVKATDREQANAILDYLIDIPKYFDGLLRMKSDAVSHDDQIEVNEKLLIMLLDKLTQKKREYLYILDRTGLIFREADEFDIDAFSRDFVEGG